MPEARDERAALDRFLRLGKVCEVVGVRKSCLYDMIARKEFPAPVKLGARAVGWSEREILDWQTARRAARDKVAVS